MEDRSETLEEMCDEVDREATKEILGEGKAYHTV
jgi:hypothetical protein